jgi:hypothetical protein
MAKSSKKITRVEGAEEALREERKFTASEESKGRARKLRIIAIVLWVLAIGSEVAAFLFLRQPEVNMTWLIVCIGVALVLMVIGNLLWKKANRLDPASEKDKFRFFVQNQLGMIISVLAFLPLVILIFTNKNLSGKQKGIVGTIAIAALAIAGLTGTDFNPPSQEQYADQIEEVKRLNNGQDYVYWTKSGKSYHIFSTCSYTNTRRTTEIFEGTVAQARELKNITDLCDRCGRQAERENAVDGEVEPEEAVE